MSGSASPVFTARVSEYILHEERPARATALSGLELHLFFPGEPPVREMSLPLEYTLQGGGENRYVHFRVNGINDTTPEQLHRLCIVLLHVRDTFFNGLMSIANTEAGSR
jgi:hypothetical protein